MEIIKLAWRTSASPSGASTSSFPPDGIPDRGTFVTDLTLIPSPTRPIDIYQPVTSPETIEYVPRAGHKAVFWLQHPESQRQKWDRYAELRATVGTAVGPGEDRCLVLNLHVGRTREEALARGRPGHDEFCKFLAPYGRFTSYRLPDGAKGRSVSSRRWRTRSTSRSGPIGSIDDVVDALGIYRELLDLRHLCLFLDLPGLTREEIDEQFHLVAEEVFPRLGEPLERRPLPDLAP